MVSSVLVPCCLHLYQYQICQNKDSNVRGRGGGGIVEDREWYGRKEWDTEGLNVTGHNRTGPSGRQEKERKLGNCQNYKKEREKKRKRKRKRKNPI